MQTSILHGRSTGIRCQVQAFKSCPSTRRSCQVVVASAQRSQSSTQPNLAAACASALVALTLAGAPVALAEFRLPPIDTDPARCERGYTGNTIGQANAVSDRLMDLRKCSYTGANLSGKTLSGALMSQADFSHTNMKEAVLTKAYAAEVNLSDADLTNAVIDRVDFTGANLSGAKFVNAVVTGTIFDKANLANSNWDEALIGIEDVKRLCSNPTLTGESRDQVGCRTSKS